MNVKKHRTDIEGLRGIAVLAVVFFHSGLQIASGGYIGVDIFFVISGYLITKTLIDNFESSQFSLFQFYERRLRRIVPAFVTVILFTGSLGLIVLFPEELEELAANINAALTLNANNWAAHSVNYFGIATEFKPLIHLWSLSIELQFYLLFPLLLTFFLYLGKRKLFAWIVLVSLIVIYGYTTLYIAKAPTQGYFSSTMRSWEFLLGALIYLSNIECRIDLKSSKIGLLFIIISFCLANEISHFPGYLALLPCLGSALILVSSNSDNPFSIILTNKLLRNVGLISYSLYLFHQPIFAYFRIFSGRKSSDFEAILLIVGAIFFSAMIWLLIEKPAQRKDRKSIIITYSFIIPSWLFSLFLAYQALVHRLPQFHPRADIAKILKYYNDPNNLDRQNYKI